ncbi:MAG: TonB-dependent receptor [Prevotella sp.]|nr:TonB-dependent receptor [Candidatus Prevotella equi]
MSKSIKHVRYALVSLLLLFCAVVQAQTVTGNVKDKGLGEAVIGATIMEEGTQNGTVTDFDGNFSLTLKGKTNKIVISYVGMQTQTIDVKGQSSVNIVLEDDNTQLNDVVVIGYGTVRKKDLTGSVSQVSAKQIENIPVSNVSEALTGKMAGVNITTTEGAPDADVKVRIRGGGSISQSNEPLYIVDGFPVSSISDISPSEIETIDVLKDASSTAIYGAQGANGVVIVTTKSGKDDKKVKIDLNGSIGWKKITKTLGVLSPYEYAYYQYENSSAGKDQNDYLGNSTYGAWQSLENWKGVQGSDYQKDIFGRTGVQRQYNINISGGNKKVKYNVGFAHNDEDCIMLGSEYSKNNINGKINAKLNKWIKLDFSARLAFQKIYGLSGGADTNESNASSSVVGRTVTWRPIEGLSAISDDDDENGASSQASPLERVNGTYKLKDKFEHRYNLGFTWTPTKMWTFKSEWGLTWKKEKDDQAWDSRASLNSKFGGGGQPQAQFTEKSSRVFRNANTLTYTNNKIFGGRDFFSVMIGNENNSTFHQQAFSHTYINYPGNFTIDDMLNNREAGQALAPSTTLSARENMISFFGRANYTLMDRYLITATIRGDGSSLFAQGRRWGWFPSVALAWRMNEEAWLKDVDWISNLKLRASIGASGNNRIASDIINVYYATSAASDRNPYFNGQPAIMLNTNTPNLYNSNLRWETTITRNVGLDFGFFRGRINGTVDFYWNTTKDLLMRTIIPGNAGFPYQYQNFGQTSNKGFELSLNGVIVGSKNFTLNGTFNIAYNANKIDKLNANASGWQTYNFGGTSLQDANVWRIEEGGRLGEVWGYRTDGYYTVYNPATGKGDLVLNQDGTWAMADGTTPKLLVGSLVPGGIKIVDQNNDNVIDDKDKVRLGNTIAQWTGGVGFDAQYRTKIGTFDAAIFANFSLGNRILNATKMQNSYFWDSKANYNIVSDMSLAKRYTWVDPQTGLNLVNLGAETANYYGGVDAVMSRLNDINGNATTFNPLSATKMVVCDQFMEDASFLRIQNITVGYTLPKNWLKKVYVQSCRIYFTAYNVACFTDYSGYDPEVDVSSKNNAMCPGVDFAAYPKSRSFVMGASLSF